MKIIYDLGSNNGDDILYYLKKGDLVVAVEADPRLCEHILTRFSNEIKEGRVVLENVVLTDSVKKEKQFFYLHKGTSVLNTFLAPADITSYNKVLLPSKSVLDVISRYGEPYYIKIDLEGMDVDILRVLFENGIRPPYISVESHSAEVFALLVAMGRYNSFKLTECAYISKNYSGHKITTMTGVQVYSFPHHSSGPFGEDLTGEWLTADHFYRQLAIIGLGWVDIHATSIIEANKSKPIRLRQLFKDVCKRIIESWYKRLV